jgi:hypothetical protein
VPASSELSPATGTRCGLSVADLKQSFLDNPFFEYGDEFTLRWLAAPWSRPARAPVGTREGARGPDIDTGEANAGPLQAGAQGNMKGIQSEA